MQFDHIIASPLPPQPINLVPIIDWLIHNRLPVNCQCMTPDDHLGNVQLLSGSPPTGLENNPILLFNQH